MPELESEFKSKIVEGDHEHIDHVMQNTCDECNSNEKILIADYHNECFICERCHDLYKEYEGMPKIMLTTPLYFTPKQDQRTQAHLYSLAVGIDHIIEDLYSELREIYEPVVQEVKKSVHQCEDEIISRIISKSKRYQNITSEYERGAYISVVQMVHSDVRCYGHQDLYFPELSPLDRALETIKVIEHMPKYVLIDCDRLQWIQSTYHNPKLESDLYKPPVMPE